MISNIIFLMVVGLMPPGAASRDFIFRCAAGEIPGCSTIHKFGQNSALNTSTYEDVWDVGGDFPYPTTGVASITKVDSTSALDKSLLEVQGLDVNGYLVVQTVMLNGATLVPLPTPLWRVFRLKNVGNTTFVGTVQAVDDADSVIYAQIQIGLNQTLMALYTIPRGKTGYLMAGGASTTELVSSYKVDGHFYIRPFGQVFQLKSTFGLETTGSSYLERLYPIPIRIPERSDLRVRAKSSKLNGGVNATFDLILLDN